MKKEIDILIIEDHLGFAEGMQLLLTQHGKVRKTNIVTNYKDSLEFLKSNSVDIVILDLEFDTNAYDGFIIANKIKQLYPSIKIMILTQNARKNLHKRLFEECKVDAYLDKKLGVEETYNAIDSLMKGKTYLDPSIKYMLEIQEFMNITDREKELLTYLEKGMLQKQIADKMYISPKTVEATIKKLFNKFKVKNSVELVAKYVRYKNANRDNFDDTTPPFKE